MKTYLQFITETATTGLYTFRRLNSQSSEFLFEWMKENQIPNPIPANELHCSVICSDCEIPGYTVDPTQIMITPAAYKIAIMNQALVVQFKSDPLVEQWQRAMNLGGKSKFPTFIAHISLSYKVPEDFDYTELKPPPTILVLQGEEIKTVMDGSTSINGHIEEEIVGTKQIYVPQTGLNLPRETLPQITQANTMEFVDWMEDQDVTVQFLSMPVSVLRCTQGNEHINPQKVESLKNSRAIHEKPFIVSKDNYIVDGHHRWVALLNRDPQSSVDAYRVNLPIQNLLEMVRNFGKTRYVA